MWHENQPPSCVPQVCKFDRYVILMFGCLLVSVIYWCYDYFRLFVLQSEKSRFLLLKVTTFIIPVAVHSSFYQSSAELRIRGFECFSPFMVTVAEVLALAVLLKSPL